MSNQVEDKQKGRMRRTRLHAPTVEEKHRHTLHNPWRKPRVTLFKDKFSKVSKVSKTALIKYQQNCEHKTRVEERVEVETDR